MYTHILNLLIKVCKMFRNFLCDVIHHKQFGLGLTYINKVCRYIVFTFDDIIALFTDDYTIYCVGY